jgi:hypothetical protein
MGLVLDVAKVIEAHGYLPLTEGPELTELGQHLFHLPHGRERGWHGCVGGVR